MTNGLVVFFETAPRRLMFQLSSPGAVELRVIMTPGTWPCNACTGLDMVPLFSNIFWFTTVTEPVIVAFFCVP